MVGRVILEVGELTHGVLEGDPQPRGGLRLGDCGGGEGDEGYMGTGDKARAGHYLIAVV